MNRRDRLVLRDRQAIPEVVDLPGGGGGGGADPYPGLWLPGAIDDEAGTITIGAGIVIDTTRCYEVPAVAVTVVGGTLAAPNYIFLELPHEGTAVIFATSLGALPQPSETVYRHPLVKVAKIQGRITVIDRLCRDVISIPGLLGRF